VEIDNQLIRGFSPLGIQIEKKPASALPLKRLKIRAFALFYPGFDPDFPVSGLVGKRSVREFRKNPLFSAAELSPPKPTPSSKKSIDNSGSFPPLSPPAEFNASTYC
jgi:hypothetical protein